MGLPLLLGLTVLAWGATIAVNETTQRWFVNDVSLRARLAASGAQDALAGHSVSGDRRRITGVLEGLAQDERIMAAEMCSPAFATVARTRLFPDAFGCEPLKARAGVSRSEAGASGAAFDFNSELNGGPVHISVHPILRDGEVDGHLVLVHDMSFVSRVSRR